ncbi:MAG: hypothetical protein R3272_15535, partial [Candidatus Promineifilaceae bacterium]|nr:hypothetical protein [Candidatus Promineifilaceae bacterium]
ETAQAAPPAAAPEETAAEPPAPEPKAPQEGPTASAAASARAEADTPQTTQSEDALSLQAIRDHWPAMVSQAGRQDKNLPALINMSKPLAIEGNTLILGFDYPMLKEKFEDKVEARTLVAEILSDLLGSKCVVRAVVTRHYTPPPSPPGATAEPAETAESVDSVEEAFHTLADELGGRIQSR